MLTSLARAALAALTSGALIGAASADENANIKTISFSITPLRHEIHVTSSDDDARWTTILAEKIPLEPDIVVDTKHPGYVERAGIFLGNCSGNACGANPRLAYWAPVERDWRVHGPFTAFDLDTAEIPVALSDAILNGCNATLQRPGGSRPHSFDVTLEATLSVNTRKAQILPLPEGHDPGQLPAFDGGDANAHTTFSLRVMCLLIPRIETAPKPVSVDIRVNQTGDTCPKDADVTAFIDYDKPMTGRFHVVHNGKPGETIEIKAREVSLAGKTWYRIERLERYELDPGKHNFRIKVIGGGESDTRSLDVECPPFKVTSTLLAYDVEDTRTCPKQVVETATIRANRPGDAAYRIKTQGGLVVTKGIAHITREGDGYVARQTRKVSLGAFDQMMRLEIVNDPSVNDQKPLEVECLEVLSGTLDLRSFAADRCAGEAAIAIRTNGAGNVPYELTCTGGRSWTRTVQARETGAGTYIAVDTAPFPVTNNEQVNCALKTAKPMKVKVLALKGHKYQCHKPSGVAGSDELTDPGRPDEPPPTRTLAGDFSFIDNGGTHCPRGGKALINFKTSTPENVHYSLDCTNGHFSGVAQAVPHPKGGYVAPAAVSFDVKQTTKASCALKSVAPGKPKVHAVKGHTFQCVRRTGPSGADDLAPEAGPGPKKPGRSDLTAADPPKSAADTGGEIIVTPSRIRCAGGTVKEGACVCAAAYKPVKAGKNAFRCVKVVVIDPLRMSAAKAAAEVAKKKAGNVHKTAAEPKTRAKTLKLRLKPAG